MTDPADFDRFMAAYPLYAAIGEARRAWLWALTAAENKADDIIAGAERLSERVKRGQLDIKYVMKPARWLHAEGWKDRAPELAKPNGDGQARSWAKIIANGNAWMLRATVSDQAVRWLVRDGYLPQEVADREWFKRQP